MTTAKQERKNNREQTEAYFGSNAVRLSRRDWIIATLIVLLVVTLAPIVWKRLESFEPAADFRVPYALSNDYWTYQRAVEQASEDERILLIGDSAVWGEYVTPQHTLSHYLNELHGEARFANGGLNGSHPLALQGLVKHYAKEIKDTRVILHCNLLWMSSPDRDLQSDKEMAFNHPHLVPQFVPSIPCYKAPTDERLGIVVDRHLPLRTWVNHLRVAGFDSLDIHSWSLDNAYANPLDRISLESPRPKEEPHSQPIAWTERGIQPQDIPWIDLDTSLQWQAFRSTVELLRGRGNSLFVIVGPFNEHMLTDASRERYRAMTRQVESWLRDESIAYHAATLLPSQEYADASHPLNPGYVRLAEEVHERADFQQWLRERP